ncbi:hypothetical protein [Tumebacillus lipolyticus]|uniref:SAF domain-containing protein n=1 Tax=Tumebacillus lipolyticus TaxID=1280370 RepID=A0ABW4ZTA5_9BACL
MGKTRLSIIAVCTSFIFALAGYYILLPTKVPVAAQVKQVDAVAGDEIKIVNVSWIIPEKTKTELVGESQLILSGKVKEILPSKWSNPNFERGEHISNVVQTDVRVQVDQVFKGQPYHKNEVMIRINKGKVGNIEWRLEGFPDFALDEEIVLFLQQDDSDNARPEEQNYVLSGMKQGKFSKSLPESTSLSNGKDALTLASLAEEITTELQAYKILTKMADPKIHKP